MLTIVTEDIFPPDTPRDDLDIEVEMRLDLGMLSCHVEERDGSLVLVTVKPGPDMIAGAGAEAEDAVRIASIAATEDGDAARLGALSQRFESGGDPGAVGRDSTGGPSYGSYQLSSRTGTMASFLRFLDRARPEFADALALTGGLGGAMGRTAGFVATWRALAANPLFGQAQHAFVKLTHYQPFVGRVRTELGLDIDGRSEALRNVTWSTAVQHGPGTRVFANALAGLGPVAGLQDRALIEAVYDERSRLDVHFRRSTDAVKQALRQRFQDERAGALAMLA